MNQNLLTISEAFAAAMKETDGVLGAWNFGSVMHGTSDEYSDVDIIFLIGGNAWKDMEAKVSAALSEQCDGVALSWGEGFNGHSLISNSYLLRKDGQVLQFDVVLLNQDCIREPLCKIHYMDLSEKDIVFDNGGQVQELCADPPHGNPWSCSLDRVITTYYFFLHMTAKYLRRQDYFKLNQTMRTLYDMHASLLLAGYDAISWGGTESRLHFLPADRQEHLKKYYCTDDFRLNRANLARSMEWFEEDMQDVLRLKSQTYGGSDLAAIKKFWQECTQGR